MGHEGEYFKTEILDLTENCQDFDSDNSNWLSSTLDSQKVKIENHIRECHQVQNNSNILGVPVSAEELKIRSELGMKIERDLEEEIKEGIYHLALRLHRIYQQRNERNAKDQPSEHGNNQTRVLSEVNISIRMEEGTKIEIREVNKEAAEKGHPCLRNICRPKNVKEVKKVDWVKTLRAGSSPVAVNRSYVSSKQKDRKLSTDPNVFSSSKLHGGRGKNAGANKKLLRLGWKF